MSKKLTILIDDSVYEGLHRVVGRGSISKFIENLARPHVAQKDLGRARMSRRRILEPSIERRHGMQRASARRVPGRRA